MFENTAESIAWSKDGTPLRLQSALRALGEDYPISEGGGQGISVRFEEGAGSGTCRVERTGLAATVKYDSRAMALRAVGSLMAGLVAENGTLEERSAFDSFGIMLDCSRNAVMKVSHFRKWLRRLALLGYNMAMLYTEDTYELPGEPYFGYLRGAYTAAELKEIDEYAWSLGVEMIPCIQTLGHMAHVLKWPAYDGVRDTRGVMLVDEDATYELIDKALARWAEVYGAHADERSRRIHVGMDETHDLGRGKFMDRFGYERGFDIFNRHLTRVVELCEKRGLRPIIWSDMYFRLSSKEGLYYDRECVIPDDVIERIPAAAQLCYWDYYHDDKAFYLDYIEKHRALGSEPIVGSGCWTWRKLWYDRYITEANAGPCIEACREANVRDLFFTLWGDDGAYCDFDSVFAGLAWCADKAFAERMSPAALSARYRAVCGADYAPNMLAGELNEILVPCSVLWDDPLLGIYLQNQRANDTDALSRASERYTGLAANLAERTGDRACGDVSHARSLAAALGMKVDIARALIEAYASKDMAELARVRDRIPAMKAALAELAASFRRMWLSRNKPFGLEVIQIRLAGLSVRFQELSDRLEEFLSGRIAAIDELNANLPHAPKGVLKSGSYQSVASASRM